MQVIYCATSSTTNKSYVGHDSKWPHRQTSHKHSALKANSKQVFHRAIRKYGWDDFTWSILQHSETFSDQLYLSEEMYIRELKTHYHDGNGYNMTFGGEGTIGWVPSQETRNKISESNMGKTAWNKGIKCEYVSDRNKLQKGKPSPNRRKSYIVTDPEGNIYNVLGLVKFCKDNKLHTGNMCSGRYRGWTCMRTIRPDVSNLNPK